MQPGGQDPGMVLWYVAVLVGFIYCLGCNFNYISRCKSHDFLPKKQVKTPSGMHSA